MAVVAAGVALPALGFTTAGITAGSFAAEIMAFLANTAVAASGGATMAITPEVLVSFMGAGIMIGAGIGEMTN